MEINDNTRLCNGILCNTQQESNRKLSFFPHSLVKLACGGPLVQVIWVDSCNSCFIPLPYYLHYLSDARFLLARHTRTSAIVYLLFFLFFCAPICLETGQQKRKKKPWGYLFLSKCSLSFIFSPPQYPPHLFHCVYTRYFCEWENERGQPTVTSKVLRCELGRGKTIMFVDFSLIWQVVFFLSSLILLNFFKPVIVVSNKFKREKFPK